MSTSHDDHQENHTEINVDTTSEQTVSSGDDGRLGELTADLQRVQAEFMNYKRRAEGERSDLMNLATARAVREFLAVRDSFDAELAHRPESIDPEWAKSIDSIRAQFDKVLKNLGVERFESVGQPFDPHLHEAVASEGDGDTVTHELQAGYRQGETVLRHAMVRVGSAPDVGQ